MSHFENHPALEERFQAHWRRRVLVRFGIMGVSLCPRVNLARVDRISLVSTLESHNHPVNIGLSTCQPLKCPPPEKINTTVGIPARRAKTSPGHLQSCYMPFAIAAVGRLGVVKQRIGSLM